MATGTVRIKGLREVQRAFRRIDKALAKEMRDALREAAEPVRQEAASLFSSVDSRSAAGYRVAVRQRGVSVEQRLKRTTGHHPEFGALQMRRALLPARAAKEDEVVRRIEKTLDDLGRRNGF